MRPGCAFLRPAGRLGPLLLLAVSCTAGPPPRDGPPPLWAEVSGERIEGAALVFYARAHPPGDAADILHRELLAASFDRAGKAEAAARGDQTADRQAWREMVEAAGGRALLAGEIQRNFGIRLEAYRPVFLLQQRARRWRDQSAARLSASVTDVTNHYRSHRDDIDIVEAQHLARLRVDRATGRMLAPAKDRTQREKALELLQQVRDGADFGHLITHWTEDLSSRESLGRFRFARHTMLPAFDDWCFQARVGDIGLVTTSQAYHIVRLNRRSSLDEVWESARTAYREHRVEQYLDALRRDPAHRLSLSPAAAELLAP